ncbi:PLP-dependent aminotransferase family protein [Clostridium sp. JN-9]|uniref:MocR-like pyridoxine biosynthesis transcription factor PdxR n=1 Tax=Clostridium sp. JN-9 TaxID=2507159 RepID=UPI000FFE19DC|nr:PLP-dependent aminotransferase family protein [Clostridium sp. JN-9]QAT39486.1 PLP-dependent aminotransferase family protein [Clostridium sp. JN-9]
MDKYSFRIYDSETPKYIQIYKYIKKQIDLNNIEDGEKLPSIRDLSKLLKVNNVTIVSAYKKLQSEGYAAQKMGSGTFAKRKDSAKSFKREYSETFKSINGDEIKKYIDFTGETACGDFFPVSTFKEVLNKVLDRDGIDALSYQEALGYKGLRKNINKFFWNNTLNMDNILIVSGAQQGIDIVSKALLNTNDNIVVEKPTYSGALNVFKWRRANIFEVNMESDGIDVDQLERIAMKNNIKCFYTMSYFQNPTGISCSLEKKKRIIELSNIYDFYIIEDDYLSELIYDKFLEYRSFKSLDKYDRVIYIKSFSKIFLPGIRIGYLISPSIFNESIQNSKINTDISTSSLMQRALDLYIEKGFWKEYISRLNTFYKSKYNYTYNCLINILKDKISFIPPRGGLHFYIKISDEINMDSIELFYKCRENKVLISPGVLFYKNSNEGKKYYRMGFTQTDNEKIKEGIEIINKILQDVN